MIVGLMSFLTPVLIAFPMEYWSYRSFGGGKRSEDQGDSYGTAIFKVFGFARPEKINLTTQTALSVDGDNGWYGAWRGEVLYPKRKA